MTRVVLSWAVLLSLLVSTAALGQPFAIDGAPGLMRLTPKGEAVYARLTTRIGAEAAQLASDMDPKELDTVLRVLRRIHAKLG